MRGMPSNLLPGEPLCSPQTTVLLESTVQLLRRLHQSDQWLPHINQHIHSHLELIGGILREEDSRSFKSLGLSPPHTQMEDVKEDKDMSAEDSGKFAAHRQTLSDTKLTALCNEVWPALAVIGGVDGGLRAGGQCMHKPSGRRAIMLGVLKKGSSLAKLQWEEADLSIRYHYSLLTHDKVFFQIIILTNKFFFLPSSLFG
uniref:Uncharacterized protein n=1 Tax=Cyprinodon variegatus TaxID=28743 RepID=A0A3Q2EB80_CYPVA